MLVSMRSHLVKSISASRFTGCDMPNCPSVSRLQLFKVFKYIVRTRITCTIKRKAHFEHERACRHGPLVW